MLVFAEGKLQFTPKDVISNTKGEVVHPGCYECEGDSPGEIVKTPIKNCLHCLIADKKKLLYPKCLKTCELEEARKKARAETAEKEREQRRSYSAARREEVERRNRYRTIDINGGYAD